MKDEMEKACGTRAFAPSAGGEEYGTLAFAPVAGGVEYGTRAFAQVAGGGVRHAEACAGRGRYLHTSVSRASAYSGRLTSQPSFR